LFLILVFFENGVLYFICNMFDTSNNPSSRGKVKKKKEKQIIFVLVGWQNTRKSRACAKMNASLSWFTSPTHKRMFQEVLLNPFLLTSYLRGRSILQWRGNYGDSLLQWDLQIWVHCSKCSPILNWSHRPKRSNVSTYTLGFSGLSKHNLRYCWKWKSFLHYNYIRSKFWWFCFWECAAQCYSRVQENANCVGFRFRTSGRAAGNIRCLFYSRLNSSVAIQPCEECPDDGCPWETHYIFLTPEQKKQTLEDPTPEARFNGALNAIKFLDPNMNLTKSCNVLF